jgi:hypothetical protein
MNDRIVYACGCDATHTPGTLGMICHACDQYITAYNLDALLRVEDAARYGTFDGVLAAIDAMDYGADDE